MDLIRKAFNHSWHPECFKCIECKEPFGPKATYLPRGENAICEACFEKIASTCPECSEKVTSNGVQAFNKTWHAKCFVCNNCKKFLEGGRFKESPLRPMVPLCGTCVGKVAE